MLSDILCQILGYLHWNGGRDSVEAFLTYCKLSGFRPPEQDNYAWASLVTVISNFFGGTGYSIGVDVAEKLDYDNYDNGTYIIKGWEIVDRMYYEGREQNHYKLRDIGDEHEDRWKNVQHQANKMIEYASQTHLLLTIDISACYRYAEYLVGVWWVDDDGEVRTKQLVRGLSGLEMR